MSGNREGGLKTKERHLARDPDWYKKIGSLGGQKKGDELARPKGFAANRELASRVGAIGGRISRRGIKNG